MFDVWWNELSWTGLSLVYGGAKLDCLLAEMEAVLSRWGLTNRGKVLELLGTLPIK
jgi:hypothetical protein